MNPYLMASFNDELEKISGVIRIQPDPYIDPSAEMEKEAFTPDFVLKLLRSKNPKVKLLGRKMGKIMQAGPKMTQVSEDVLNLSTVF